MGETMTQPFAKPNGFDQAGVGTVGGRYALVDRLGEGGMGQVYRARHIQLGKQFALKIISPAFADDTSARARFNQEAKLASEISHPNIVSVVDYGEDAHFGAYMVMELVDGEPLLGTQTDPMGVRRTCEVLAQIADALHHIHTNGIIHGDVKAENILLVTEATNARRRCIARLLDFGLARRGGDACDSQLNGTPQYMAPERVIGGKASVSSDVYALGVLAYYMFTGTLPFDGSVVEVMMAQIHNTPPTMSERRGDKLDDALEALVARAMSKDPATRHPSAAAFRYELNTVMHMLGMQRRRRTSQSMRAVNPREVTFSAAFEQSKLPQAMVSADGEIAYANGAFGKLVACTALDGVGLAETALAAFVPKLLKNVRDVHVSGRPAECRARVARSGKSALDLVVWLSPLPIPGSDVHVIVHVTEIPEPAR